MKVGTALARMLKDYKVKHVFGVPGVQTLALYEGIYDLQPEITHIGMRDERNASFAADAYAKFTGKVGVCDATVGPGAILLPAGLGEAYNSSVPVLAIIADIPSGWQTREEYGNASQGFDQIPMFKTITKWQAKLEHPENLPRVVRHAFRVATSERPGPVLLDIPHDIFDTDFEFREEELYAEEEFSGYPSLRVAPDPSKISEAVKLLSEAEKPVIIAGGGVHISGAYEELLQLAEHLVIPVATTITGKGSIPETHPLSLGVVGLNGRAHANKLVSEADLIFFIGCKAGQFATFNWTLPREDAKIIHMDIDPKEMGRNFRTDVKIPCDVKLGLRMLNDALKERVEKRKLEGSEVVERIRKAYQEWWSTVEEKVNSDASPMKPQRLVKEISEFLGEDDIFVSDAAYQAGWSACYLTLKRSGRSYITNRGLAGIGYGLPAAIGVQVAARDRHVIAITGDGSFGYTVGEMESCIRHNLPITLIIFNNQCFGWIKWAQKLFYCDKCISVDFAQTDFVKIAEGYGWKGMRIERPDEVRDALKEAKESGKPTLIDARIDFFEAPVIPYAEEARKRGIC
ncbi:MAG: acetolactate synthase large subunit [Archaeoglobi archaeon]|nr:acetolactate synthase large subunit [Archaeoglobi archaeon]